jgi:hypothetical protein
VAFFVFQLKTKKGKVVKDLADAHQAFAINQAVKLTRKGL